MNMFIGSGSGGILHFTTYSYDNMVGGGNVNSWQNINYENQLFKWHFVYFGYSRA
jgi:hypothetical protein